MASHLRALNDGLGDALKQATTYAEDNKTTAAIAGAGVIAGVAWYVTRSKAYTRTGSLELGSGSIDRKDVKDEVGTNGRRHVLHRQSSIRKYNQQTRIVSSTPLPLNTITCQPTLFGYNCYRLPATMVHTVLWNVVKAPRSTVRTRSLIWSTNSTLWSPTCTSGVGDNPSISPLSSLSGTGAHANVLTKPALPPLLVPSLARLFLMLVAVSEVLCVPLLP